MLLSWASFRDIKIMKPRIDAIINIDKKRWPNRSAFIRAAIARLVKEMEDEYGISGP